MSSPRTPPISVGLLAVPDVGAATLFGVFDLLAGVRRDWQVLMTGKPVESPIRPLIVSRDGHPIRTANGVLIEPHLGFDEATRLDVVCVTDLTVPPSQPLGDRYDPEADWLRRQYAQGATVSSACSGALLMARAGLLDGQDGTSHWAYCDTLRREYPRTNWRLDRALVLSGENQRIVMAGSGTSWHALALYLIARFVGPEEAMQTARVNLLDWGEVQPLAYAALTAHSTSRDAVIERCQQWAAMHYTHESPVSAMAALTGLAERTFKRRFQQATGMSPLDYVHTVRLEEAKQMLESGTLSIEAVAQEVGYQDSAFFSRLFRRKTGLTPGQYRKRFGQLRQRLHEATAQDTTAPPAGTSA
jgi:transcriptional regulator GlxA family with amidase domain